MTDSARRPEITSAWEDGAGYRGGHGFRPAERPTTGPTHSPARRLGYAPRGYERTDASVCAALCELLMGGEIDPRGIAVCVTDGRVLLEGHVPRRADAAYVESLAWRVPGVRAVDCNLIEGPPR